MPESETGEPDRRFPFLRFFGHQIGGLEPDFVQVFRKEKTGVA